MKPIKDWFKSFTSSDPRTTSRHATPPLVAYFWDGGCPVAHTVKNVSSSGFYLETAERWLLGTLVMMTLQRTGHDPLRADYTVIVMSKVVRYGDDGVGFSFIVAESPASAHPSGPLSQPADRRMLDKFLEMTSSGQDYPGVE